MGNTLFGFFDQVILAFLRGLSLFDIFGGVFIIILLALFVVSWYDRSDKVIALLEGIQELIAKDNESIIK